MNKTVIFIVFATLAALGIVGAIVLLLHRPDATATFTAFVVQILGIAAIAAGTFYGFGKTNEKLEEVRAQTNGNLSAKEDQIAALTAELIKANRLLHPDNFDQTTGATVDTREG